VSADAPPTGSRGNYDSLVPWARQLFREGKSVDEVIRVIYGVRLPAEFFVFDRAVPSRLPLPVLHTYHPWELLKLADPAASVRGPDRWARRQEEHAFAHNPSFLPLMQLGASEATHGGYTIGYDVEELRRGKSTIFGHRGDIPAGGPRLEMLGTSLLAVLHDWMSDHHRQMKAQYESPRNFGAGSLDPEDVEEIAGFVRGIVALEKETAILEIGA